MTSRVRNLGLGLVLLGMALLTSSVVLGGTGPGGLPGMMGGSWSGGPGSMMGGRSGTSAAGPGQSGFVPGTVTAPRVVRVIAGPGYTFSPAVIDVARGETISFQVTSMGGLVHEFMVGPEAAVVADAEGTPEIADLGMMVTKTLTYTFDGAGPYAFACHEQGHFEAGMRGTIRLVG